MPESAPSACVIVTTKNRKDELCKALASCLAQTAKPEVLVIDDGSTDGTADCVRQRFPGVRVHRDEPSRGLIVQRSRAAKLTAAPIIFSLDDDAIFSSPKIVEDTLRDFDHPRVGAVAIPFVDMNHSPQVRQRAPGRDRIYAIYSFIGTAHALRRDLFLSLGGYREILIHQGEEEDYCARMLERGWITRCGSAEPIHHFESPRRSWERMDYYGARNKVLYAWHNVPWPYLSWHLPVTTAMVFCRKSAPRRIVTRWRGVLAACGLIISGRVRREAVSPETYRLTRLLRGSEAVALDEIESRLPRLVPAGLEENNGAPSGKPLAGLS